MLALHFLPFTVAVSFHLNSQQPAGCLQPEKLLQNASLISIVIVEICRFATFDV